MAGHDRESLEQWEHTTASFVVRFRRCSPRPGSAETEGVVWLGRIEHVQTGQQAPVQSVQDVALFIGRRLKEQGATQTSIMLNPNGQD